MDSKTDSQSINSQLLKITVGLRPKLFLVFFACGIAPVLSMGIINYLSGASAIETLLRDELEGDALRMARDVEALQREREDGLIALAGARSLRRYVLGKTDERPATTGSSDDVVPDDVRADVRAFFLSNQRYYTAIKCLNVARETLFRAEPGPRGDMDPGAEMTSVRFQTEDFPSGISHADERVWQATEQKPLRSSVARGPTGTVLHYTVPIFAEVDGGTGPRGALVADLKLDALFKDAADDGAGLSSSLPIKAGQASTPRLFIALDSNGYVIYHTNHALMHQHVSGAMPYFKPVAGVMLAGENGERFYDSTEGDRWLAVYRPLKSFGVSVAAAGDYTAAVRGVRRTGWLSIILSVLFGVLIAVLLTLMVGRMARSIERVTEGAVAIAGGNLDQHIEVRSSDETRVLAETFNLMTARLREQIAREAELRQFESFMRISAMLTHDLKNAIASLSLVVGNMERQFHREEFRADAMRSLTEATDKLRALVAKLSAPVESLSGEYKRPRPTDIVPIIKHVLAATAEPSGALHKLEARLPASLTAMVDPDRIGKVIENLVINALEAMSAKGGKLTVEAGPADTDHIFLSVADTGPGMDEEFIRTRLFRPFATTKKQGVGLGLYTCRALVRAYGGEIEVKSQKGAGTCFRIVLPSGPITDRS
ncbi:MAG TPA: ATP-binding protein [Pyrinomonadaceae bacterium]|nr:ATP-binding protein [Pyrinomonadaceae bacterium]